VNVSERLREALERLDQAIDRLDANAAAGTGIPAANGDAAPHNNAAVVAAKLERMIQRIETALAN
jgi:hypothetical protein